MIFKNLSVVFAALTAVAPVAGVKAFKDFGTVGTFQLSFVIEARDEGDAGITFALTADGQGEGNLTVAGSAYVYHYEPGITKVSMVQDIVDMIGPSIGPSIQVRTFSATPNVVLVNGDAFGATALAGNVTPSGQPLTVFSRNISQSDLWLISGAFAGVGQVTAWGYLNSVWYLVNDRDKIITDGKVGVASAAASSKSWFVSDLGAFERVYFSKTAGDGTVDVTLTDILATSRKN